MNETTINGIDVSECAYFNSVTYEEPYCNIDQERLYACSGDENCYFKQFKRLQQENEKLKASANEAKIEFENLLINRNDFAERAEKLEQENKELKEKIDIYENSIIANHDRAVGKRLMEVLQTLEEIRDEIGDLKDINKLINLQKILDLINEVLK